MSGGHYDYIQHRLEDDVLATMKEDIRVAVENKENDWGYRPDYSQETIDILKRGRHAVAVAVIYLRRIDWFLSGDDGEEQLFLRLREELEELENQQREGNHKS